MPPIRVAINGAAGRMGARLVALIQDDPQLELAAALDRPAHLRQGEDAGTLAGVGPIGIPLGSQLPPRVDVVIDFSTPAGAMRALEACLERGLPLVMATTGLEADDCRRVEEAAGKIPLLWAPNMSLAVNLLMKLSAVAAGALKSHPSGVDVEIIERHHRFKEDAPSGTALKFGQIIAAEMGQTKHQHGRAGRPGVRPRDEIGYHAVRVGDNPGEHTIIFGLLGESIELVVRATSRDAYAQGALSAAKFLVGRPAGRYGINDVLGL